MTFLANDFVTEATPVAMTQIRRDSNLSQTTTTKRIRLPAIDACQGSIFSTLKQREENGERVGHRDAWGSSAPRMDQLKRGLGYFFGTR